MEAYKELERLYTKVHNLSHLVALGSWDTQTKMPPKGAPARGAAMGELSAYIFQLLTAPSTKGLLEAAQAATAEMNAEQRANLREMQRQYDTQSMLPSDFVMRKSKLRATGAGLWAKARKENDFSLYMPALKEMMSLAREEAQLRSAVTGKSLYESLFNEYECGMSLETVDRVFADVKSWLPELLQKILAAQKDSGVEVVEPEGLFAKDKQDALNRHVMKVWGYDFEAGRLDESPHPFTGMVKEDSRVTTHYYEEDYTKALFATIHETGHSRYETGCGPVAMRGQPVCNARSLSIHESQSRFAEVVMGRSGAFAEYISPFLLEHLGDQPAFTVEKLRHNYQTVKPDFIRIYADEVCYPLHVILRYEIERALIEGTMEVEDIPRVWNAKMKEYLGLETEGHDDIGCLQDVHWSMGLVGYFPTYSLGSMFAVQLMATIKKELGEDTVDKCIRTGNLEPIFAKQKEKIWDNGCLYETEDLIKKATGEPLNTKYFREYLERRYLRKED